jgi:hypothetical protein
MKAFFEKAKKLAPALLTTISPSEGCRCAVATRGKTTFICSVKGLPDVKLEEEGWDLALVKSPRKVTQIQEVIMNTSSLDERTLGV